MLLTGLLLAWLFFRFARQDEEREALLRPAAEHGVALTDERAALAAGAGTADELRERLLAGSGRPRRSGGGVSADRG